jgi:Probable cobalt transporter subunit (CbtB)
MADTTLERRTPAAPGIPVVSPRELAPYAIFAGIVLLLLIYFVGAEEGATSIVSGHYVHEFVHDARHLLGFPCH